MARRKGFNRSALCGLALTVSVCLFAGCGHQVSVIQKDGEESSGAAVSTEAVDNAMELTQSELDTEFTDREQDGSYEEAGAQIITLVGDTSSVQGEGASAEKSQITIRSEGIYIVRGTLMDGQIIVDADDGDKVQIVLDSAVVHCEKSAAIYVKQADKVFLTLAKDSENTLSGGSAYQDSGEDTVDGVVFSKADFCINGQGSLTVDAAYKHGIVSKDDLVITGGQLQVSAQSQCLSGKDAVKIKDGTFVLQTEGKAVESENTEKTELGNIYIAGGTFTIKSTDDAFHAGGSLVVDGGSFTIDSGDDAFHSDVDTVVNGGKILVNSCYEGLEGHRVVINGGDITVTSGDDGINAAAPDSASEEGDGQMPSGSYKPDGSHKLSEGQDGAGRPGEGRDAAGGSMGDDTAAYIKITGGTITVNTSCDGLDSNGSLFISGGATYINGPVSDGDSSLDYDRSAQVTGGILIAAGSSGMAQTFGETSTQCSIQQDFEEQQKAGTQITLTDPQGSQLLAYTPTCQYSSVIVTCPELKEGETYTLTVGPETTELTLDSPVTSNATGERKPGVPASSV